MPEEIKHRVGETGFQLAKLCPILDLNAESSEITWNAIAIAQAKWLFW